MLKQSILSVTPAFAIATAIVLATPAAPAFAQYRPGNSRDSRSYQSRAYDYGYRDGLSRGEQDGRSNRAYSLDQSREYQNADRGYERSQGNLRTYQQTYRDAYATGYRDGYERYRSNTGYGGGTVYGGIGSGGYGRDGQRYPGYPSTGRDDRSGYGYSPGFDSGYSDGYEQGAEDGEDRDRFDPMRHGRYKSADRGYNRQYGSKDAYKNTYREGFRSGYDRGYRDSQQYSSRSSRTTRQSPGWWPF